MPRGIACVFSLWASHPDNSLIPPRLPPPWDTRPRDRQGDLVVKQWRRKDGERKSARRGKDEYRAAVEKRIFLLFRSFFSFLFFSFLFFSFLFAALYHALCHPPPICVDPACLYAIWKKNLSLSPPFSFSQWFLLISLAHYTREFLTWVPSTILFLFLFYV